MKKANTEEQRFFAKVKKSRRADGCWTWTATGTFASRKFGRLVRPRRWMWAHVHDGQLPDSDRIVRVRCGNSDCVRPEHLYLFWKGRRSDTHCSRGHSISDDNGYWLTDGTWLCRPCKRDLARKYREDPEFRAKQVEQSRTYMAEHPEKYEAKKIRQRERYAMDPAYRAKIREASKRRREKRRESQAQTAEAS